MKPNSWVSSSQAKEMLTKQLVTWELAAKNYRDFQNIQYKTFSFDGFEIKVQFNPSRVRSSGANVDPDALKKRRCFLCPDHLPVEQERLPFGSQYLVLCNPYPIFPEHFTISTRQHQPQLIEGRYGDMLEMARRLDQFTVFYNGPQSGASAPDHMHFQAGTRNYMPLDYEKEEIMKNKLSLVLQNRDGEIYALKNYLRNGFIITSTDRKSAEELFRKVYKPLNKPEGTITEPMMNLFCRYENNTWITTVIPRKAHRPRQYYSTGTDHLLSSPGAADMGGLFIISQPDDFRKISAGILADIYEQLCLGNDEIDRISDLIKQNKIK